MREGKVRHDGVLNLETKEMAVPFTGQWRWAKESRPGGRWRA